MRSILILAVIFVAASLDAAWDSRFFPTTDSPVRVFDGSNVVFAEDVIVSQMVYAANERWVVVNDGDFWPEMDTLEPLIEIGVVRFPELVLENIKSAITNMCGFYVNMVDGPYTADKEVIYWDVESLVAAANLPTNYFQYTPARFLMQSSNGWDGAYRVFNLLTTTKSEIPVWRTNYFEQAAGGFPDAAQRDGETWDAFMDRMWATMCGGGYVCVSVSTNNVGSFAFNGVSSEGYEVGIVSGEGSVGGLESRFFRHSQTTYDTITAIGAIKLNSDQHPLFYTNHSARLFLDYEPLLHSVLTAGFIATNYSGHDFAVWFADNYLSLQSVLDESRCDMDPEDSPGSPEGIPFVSLCVANEFGLDPAPIANPELFVYTNRAWVADTFVDWGFRFK